MVFSCFILGLFLRLFVVVPVVFVTYDAQKIVEPGLCLLLLKQSPRYHCYNYTIIVQRPLCNQQHPWGTELFCLKLKGTRKTTTKNKSTKQKRFSFKRSLDETCGQPSLTKDFLVSTCTNVTETQFVNIETSGTRSCVPQSLQRSAFSCRLKQLIRRFLYPQSGGIQTD